MILSLTFGAVFFAGLAVGLLVGARLEALQWRAKGDHDYMNRMASGKHLYNVKRES
jgi:hypothetical protein